MEEKIIELQSRMAISLIKTLSDLNLVSPERFTEAEESELLEDMYNLIASHTRHLTIGE